MTGGGVLYTSKGTQSTVMKAANLQSPKQKCHCHHQVTTKNKHDDVSTILTNHLIIIYPFILFIIYHYGMVLKCSKSNSIWDLLVKFWVIENCGKPLSSLSSGLPNVHHKSYLDVGCNNYLGPLSLSHLWCPPDPLAGREEARTGPHTASSSGWGVGGIQVMVSG